jgi:hypothetical protein
MARPQIDLGRTIEAEIRIRAARGENARTIAEALGQPKLQQTINRRIKKLAGQPAKRAAEPAKTTSPEDVPDNVPENTPTEDLDRWLAAVEKGLSRAEADGNLSALASLAAKATALMALRHKSAPLPKPDPNDNPDYVAAKEKARARFLALIDDAIRNAG